MRAYVAPPAFVVAVCLLPGAPVAAQDVQFCSEDGLDWSVGPTIVPGDGFWTHLGLRGDADLCKDGHTSTGGGSFSYVAMLGGQYLWVDSAVDVPDATEVRATGLLSWSIPGGRPERIESRDPDDLLRDDDEDGGEGGDLNPGFLEFGGTAAYEANPNRTEQHLTFGGEVRYANNSPHVLGQFIPSIVARWERIEPTASDARDALTGVRGADEGHGRWSVRGYLNVRFRYLTTALSALGLQVDASLFRANGLAPALEDAGWDSGEYISVKLRLSHRIGLYKQLAITSIYAGYTAGQLPTDFEGREALSGGLTLSIGG